MGGIAGVCEATSFWARHAFSRSEESRLDLGSSTCNPGCLESLLSELSVGLLRRPLSQSSHVSNSPPWTGCTTSTNDVKRIIKKLLNPTYWTGGTLAKLLDASFILFQILKSCWIKIRIECFFKMSEQRNYQLLLSCLKFERISEISAESPHSRSTEFDLLAVLISSIHNVEKRAPNILPIFKVLVSEFNCFERRLSWFLSSSLQTLHKLLRRVQAVYEKRIKPAQWLQQVERNNLPWHRWRMCTPEEKSNSFVNTDVPYFIPR